MLSYDANRRDKTTCEAGICSERAAVDMQITCCVIYDRFMLDTQSQSRISMANIFNILFKYMASVLTIARNFNLEAAVKYDADFRHPKSKSPTLPWDVIHQELYLLAAAKATVAKRQPFRLPTANPCPPGYCFRFHSTGTCPRPNCVFKHQCYRCQGNHAAKLCVSKPSSKPKSANTIANPNQST